MSLTFKLGSLAIRTLAKPLSNYIKRNAREHDRFRSLCVGFAQRLHQIDMRLRLGLLQDPAAIDRQIARELKDVERARQKAAIPTVKTEEQIKAEEEALKSTKKKVEEHVKASHKPPRIRPLSEAKAIDTGANFISETFLFIVAGGLILLETFRRDRKDKKQDEDVNQKLEAAEMEREEMKAKMALMESELEALLNKKPFQATGTGSKKASGSSAVVLQTPKEPSQSKGKPKEAPEMAGSGSPVVMSSSIAQTKEKQETGGDGLLFSAWLPKSLFGGGKGPSS